MSFSRRRAVGAEATDEGVHFRVWAPGRKRLSVVTDSADLPLDRESDGHFSGLIKGLAAGARYRFRIDGGKDLYPDPASRFQPEGPHGPSEVVDPHAYRWNDRGWKGITRHGLVISEIHIGTFTPEGTFAAAAEKLPLLADAGINTIEVMPVNEFPGNFGWGYDGVDIWAVTRLYGRPDDFRRFVDKAHAHGVGVILDVVYNHFGPDGCFLPQFTPAYFTKKYENEWGDAINFDGDDSRGVREFFIDNAAHWVDEFHLDGLRLDATQAIHDSGTPNIMREISDAARGAASGRTIFVVGENEPQDVNLLTEYGLDALWNDDWHHAAHVAITGRAEAYYTDYRGTAQEFVSMARLGFLYQGQYYSWQKNRRGTPSIGIPADRFVCYAQNHDQIANSAAGHRLHDLTSPPLARALSALLLLAPQTPMLFQGQEFAASSPFLYFADHKPDLAELVTSGRTEFLAQFPSIKSAEMTGRLAPPHERATFERCKLDWSDRDRNSAVLQLHRDLLALRRSDPAFAAQDNRTIEGSVVNDDCLLMRWLCAEGDRLLIVNFGCEVVLTPGPQPLLAPPRGREWRILWSSESPQYGGFGTPPVESKSGWRIAGQSAVVLAV